MAIIQLIVTSFAFSTSKPFRMPLYHNTPFIIALSLLSCFGLYVIVFNEHKWLQEFFQIVVIPAEFRYIMLMLVLGNTSLTLIYEKFLMSKCLAPITQMRTELARVDQIAAEMNATRD